MPVPSSKDFHARMRGGWAVAKVENGTWAERRELVSAALIYDGEQAWSHYRHLESQRSQYLGFVFTAVLGVSGLLVAVVSGGKSNVEAVVAGAAIMSFVLLLLCFLIYAAVRKVGAALHFHHAEIDAVRLQLFKEFVDESDDFGSRQYARHRVPALMKTKIFSTQGIAELTLLSFLCAFWACQVSLAVYAAFFATGPGVWRFAIVGLGVVAFGLAVAHLIFHFAVSRRKE